MTTTKTATKAATISLEEMVGLKAKGLSLAQIGKMAGISKQAVSQRLKASGLDPEAIGQFKRDKSLILHAKQKILLEHITPERVKTMTVRDATVSLGIIYDKTRLQDDKSTTNLAASFTQINLSLVQAPSPIDITPSLEEKDITPPTNEGEGESLAVPALPSLKLEGENNGVQ
jgi:transposase